MIETAVVYRRFDLFNILIADFNDDINTSTSGSLAALVKMSTEFGWTEEMFGQWFRAIKGQLEEADYG